MLPFEAFISNGITAAVYEPTFEIEVQAQVRAEQQLWSEVHGYFVLNGQHTNFELPDFDENIEDGE